MRLFFSAVTIAVLSTAALAQSEILEPPVPIELDSTGLPAGGIIPHVDPIRLPQLPAEANTAIDVESIATEQSTGPISDPPPISFGHWLGYNATKSDTTWLVGNNDDFGIFSLESYPTLSVGDKSALVLGMGFHFLDGPVRTDMPPRLFDFHLAFHNRKIQTDHFMLDLKAGIGAFSDFEGSARNGVRFPGHVVTYYQWRPTLVSVLGIEVLDRDDVSLLPVAGLVLRPTDDLILDLVFPRPQIRVKLDSGQAIYVSGELGGDTWAIKRSNSTNDTVTYQDLRVVLGVMNVNDNHHHSFEIGWAFDREITYRSGLGNYRPEDALILRLRAHY